MYQSHLINLNMYIDILFHYQGHLSELESQMVSLANEIEEYKIKLRKQPKKKRGKSSPFESIYCPFNINSICISPLVSKRSSSAFR